LAVRFPAVGVYEVYHRACIDVCALR